MGIREKDKEEAERETCFAVVCCCCWLFSSKKQRRKGPAPSFHLFSTNAFGCKGQIPFTWPFSSPH